MSQAYQAPHAPTPKDFETDLPIQRPNPKFLIRRAVDRFRATQSTPYAGIQWPQSFIPPAATTPMTPSSATRLRSPQATAVRSKQLPSQSAAVKSAPAQSLRSTRRLPQLSFPLKPAPYQSSQRIKIDWQARLREARQRLAAARRAQEMAAAERQALHRAASALTAPTPIRRDVPVSRQSKFSQSRSHRGQSPQSRRWKSRRRRTTATPVIRAGGVSSARLRVPDRLQDAYRWPTNRVRRPRVAPRSGSQLYAQRLNALRVGQLYTRMPVDSFYDQWIRAKGHPSYGQWRDLLALEARAAGRGKGRNSLTAMVGDSLSQWFPADQLPGRQIWLNQSISGDTTAGILKRLAVLKNARPDTVYLMAGVNDLKRGATDREILRNIHQILRRLRQQHPQAQIVVQSILPTRSDRIPNARIGKLNPMIQALSQRHGVDYLDLHQQFRDWDGGLRADLTTDGIHLSPQGYQVWQAALQRMNQRLAQRPRTIAQAQALRENL